MNNYVINIFFTLFTIYTFLKIISYGIYEYKSNNNKLGCFTIIIFSFFCSLFGIIMFWIN